MTTLVKFRMENEDKEVLESMLKDMGLDLDTAFRIFTQKVLKTGKIPFELSSSVDTDTLWTKEDERAYKKALRDLENKESLSLDALKEKYL